MPDCLPARRRQGAHRRTRWSISRARRDSSSSTAEEHADTGGDDSESDKLSELVDTARRCGEQALLSAAALPAEPPLTLSALAARPSAGALGFSSSAGFSKCSEDGGGSRLGSEHRAHTLHTHKMDPHNMKRLF